ncbi:hypothetical protein ACUYGS_23870 [Escherichia coli]
MMPVSHNLCIFLNVGLGEAAKRNVGTGANQIPDMGSFTLSVSGTGYQKLPSGFILQWGSIGAPGIAQDVVTHFFPNCISTTDECDWYVWSHKTIHQIAGLLVILPVQVLVPTRLNLYPEPVLLASALHF